MSQKNAKIKCHTLYISNPSRSLKFYMNTLGMHLVKHKFENNLKHYYLSCDTQSEQAFLELIYDKDNYKKTKFPHHASINNGYWKMALGIADINLAREKILAQGIYVSQSMEVPNVGYLCHMRDPDGYTIELIQHTFEKNFVPRNENSDYPLGNKPNFLLITLRSRDIRKSLDFYTKELGMNLLSTMEVSDRGFDLYFLGFSEEKCLSQNKEEHAQWLWQRDFTMIELQHIHDRREGYNATASVGFEKITLLNEDIQVLHDPDGYKIKVETH